MIRNNAYPFLNELDIDQDVKRRLSILLDGVVKGNSEIFVTPLGANGNAKSILSELDKVFEDNKHRMNDTLKDLEYSNKDKFGPRSIAVPWSERKKILYESFEYDRIDGKIDIDLAPSRKSLRPISLSKALTLLKNDTNSGLPYYTRKSKIKERVLKDFDYLQSSKYPCILFTRTQESEKTRNVWGFPISETLNEMMYYSPLLEYQKHQSYRSALVGPDEVGRHVSTLVLRAVELARTLVSIDFGKYDNTVRKFLQAMAFDYIKRLFQSECSSDISKIANTFNTIGILTPDGVRKGAHGVPSGSTFTNEVDSIAQMLISIQLPFVELDSMQVQGDDGVYLIPNGKEDELFKQFESFGLSVNREKSFVAKDYAIFLQCLFHVDYIKQGKFGGIYPIYRALNRLCYQERWSDFEDHEITGKDFYSIRALCILENCKYHPLFEDLVKLVVKHDKYSLDFSSQGLSNYVRMLDQTKGTEGILQNQYGDNIKGIKSFESYKLVKGLS